jgi:hypothetical protein
LLLPATGASKAADEVAMSAYLAMWGLFTAGLFVGTLKINRALQVVFATLVVLFLLLAIGDYTNAAPGFRHFTGFEGIVCGAAAIYAGLALVLNELFGKTVLAIGPVRR